MTIYKCIKCEIEYDDDLKMRKHLVNLHTEEVLLTLFTFIDAKFNCPILDSLAETKE